MSLLNLAGAHQRVLHVSGGCHTCPRKRVDFVPSRLVDGPILFLGEAPGKNDVEEGAPFAGDAGKLLASVAAAENVPGPWSFSHTIHCRPPEGAAPTPKEVGCCLSELTLAEIKDYKVVVLCGNVPLQALFPGARADHFRGNVAWHPDFPGQRFYATYSPAYILRRPDLRDEFSRQINRIGRVTAGEPEPSWVLLRGGMALRKLKTWAAKAPLLSIDFETTGLESWAVGIRIKSLAVTTMDCKEVVVGHEDEPYFGAMLALLAQFAEREDASALGNNIAFDLEMLERDRDFRVRCKLLHETSVQWYQAKQYKMPSLKELVSRELDGYRHLVHEPHLMRDVDLLLKYNAEDVVYPCQLMRLAMKQIPSQTRDLCARVLGPVSLILRRMTATGFYVREDYRQEKIQEYEDKRRTILAAWKGTDPEFIPDTHESGKGLLHYLYTMRGFPVLGKTEAGDPSTDASALKQLVRDGHGVVQHLLDLREVDKVLSTYLRAYDKLLWPDSRLRASYPLTWTDSGRTSSRKPNLQNIPRNKEIRDLFGVPDGSVLLEADLSQIEFRIMVCLAGDENGINGYLRGDDAHTMTARSITGSDTPTKAQRSLAKPVNFGFLFGGSEYMVQGYVADEYGIVWSIDTSRDYRDTFMRTYPKIPIFHAASEQKLLSNRGHFESVVGHRFYYEDWQHNDGKRRDHAVRAALNAEAQGPAAQICFYIMVIARRLLDARGFSSVEFVNTVHDSVLVEIPDARWVQDVAATINEAAQQAHAWVARWFTVPLIMEHASGPSWGSLKEIKV